ncbi:hypothetical protein EOL73_02310 [Candidatus Saccharibacteria bacterium]|nr:hypothetical protein [Candidatus Saccharibacteria bacterium]NCU40569.1 hypothetical protein [Candidatus Saccharibacteria bacterium]
MTQTQSNPANPNLTSSSEAPAFIYGDLDRVRTIEDIEGVSFKAREVLSGSEHVKLRAGEVAANVSSAVDGALYGLTNLKTFPFEKFYSIKEDWYAKKQVYYKEKVGKSVIPALNKYYKKRAGVAGSMHTEVARVRQNYTDIRKGKKSEYIGRRDERQGALDLFAERRVKMEIERLEHIEANGKKRYLKAEKPDITDDEVERKVKEHLDNPKVKTRIARSAIGFVKKEL